MRNLEERKICDYRERYMRELIKYFNLLFRMKFIKLINISGFST